VNETLLCKGLSLLGISDTGPEIESLRIYIRELERWNAKIGLVHASGDELIVRHILDSLSALSLIRALPHEKIADVGSGGGLPGIPLAVCIPEAEFTLVERSGKKAGFLRDCSITLGLSGRLQVLECDLREVRDTFDVVTFRALGRLEEYAGELIRITGEGGALAAYKGKLEVAEAEIESIRKLCGRSEIQRLFVPFLDEERHLVILKRD